MCVVIKTSRQMHLESTAAMKCSGFFFFFTFLKHNFKSNMNWKKKTLGRFNLSFILVTLVFFWLFTWLTTHELAITVFSVYGNNLCYSGYWWQWPEKDRLPYLKIPYFTGLSMAAEFRKACCFFFFTCLLIKFYFSNLI